MQQNIQSYFILLNAKFRENIKIELNNLVKLCVCVFVLKCAAKCLHVNLSISIYLVMWGV